MTDFIFPIIIKALFSIELIFGNNLNKNDHFYNIL